MAIATSRPFKCLPTRAWIGGVASGLAYALGWPTWVVRMLWVLSVLCLGFGTLAYVLLWLLVPNWGAEPVDYASVTDDTEHA